MLVSVVTIAFQCLSLPTLTKNILTGTSPITTRTSKYMHLYLRHGWASLECRAISSCTLYLRLPTVYLSMPIASLPTTCTAPLPIARMPFISGAFVNHVSITKYGARIPLWNSRAIILTALSLFLVSSSEKRWKSGLLSLRSLCACRARSSFDRLKSPFFPASR